MTLDRTLKDYEKEGWGTRVNRCRGWDAWSGQERLGPSFCQQEDMPGSRSHELLLPMEKGGSCLCSLGWMSAEVRRAVQRQGWSLILNITWRLFAMYVGRRRGSQAEKSLAKLSQSS